MERVGGAARHYDILFRNRHMESARTELYEKAIQGTQDRTV